MPKGTFRQRFFCEKKSKENENTFIAAQKSSTFGVGAFLAILHKSVFMGSCNTPTPPKCD